MTKYSLGLMEVRIVHNQRGEDMHVSNFNQTGDDLLTVWATYLRTVKRDHGVKGKERFFIPDTVSTPTGIRQVRSEIDYGRYGVARRVRDTSTGDTTGNVGTDETASDTLRTCLVVPQNGKIALLAHEVAGVATLGGALTTDVKRWFQQNHPGYRLSIDYLEDADAWAEFLDGADLRQITFTAWRSSPDNRAGVPTKEEYDVRPIRGRVLPRAWLDRLLNHELPASAVLSVPVEDGDIDETTVVVSKEGRRRTIRIGQDWPRFTWEINPDSDGRPVSAQFYAVANELVAERLDQLNAVT